MRSDKDREETADQKRRDTPGKSDQAVGNALRAVYQDAVSEDVPDEMLDLLKKLG